MEAERALGPQALARDGLSTEGLFRRRRALAASSRSSGRAERADPAAPRGPRSGGGCALVGRAKIVNEGRDDLRRSSASRFDGGQARARQPRRAGTWRSVDNVFINYGISLVSSAHVTIGDDCLIGTHVMVMDCDFHRVDDKRYDTSGKPITLETGSGSGIARSSSKA